LSSRCKLLFRETGCSAAVLVAFNFDQRSAHLNTEIEMCSSLTTLLKLYGKLFMTPSRRRGGRGAAGCTIALLHNSSGNQ